MSSEMEHLLSKFIELQLDLSQSKSNHGFLGLHLKVIIAALRKGILLLDMVVLGNAAYSRYELWTKEVSHTLNVCLNYLWEFTHTHKFGIANSTYHDAFSLASYALVAFREISFHRKLSILQSQELIKMCDIALLLGSRRYNHEIIMKIKNINSSRSLTNLCDIKNSITRKRRRSEGAHNQIVNIPHESLSSYQAIVKTDNLSLAHFYNNYLMTSTPIVVSGCMNDWPALSDPLRKWSNLEYIRRVAGNRVVPVELGDSYTSMKYSQKLMTVGAFIDTYIYNYECGSNAIGYLAQHQLFDQITELRNDFVIPDYCAMLLSRDDITPHDNDLPYYDTEYDDNVRINAWLGPIATVSPLHHDPYHNFLAQIVGYKYVRLYAPAEHVNLYPHDGPMYNTSQVDLRNIDEARFPNAANASYQETILRPGEMIFIPRWHWHYICPVDATMAEKWLNAQRDKRSRDFLDRTINGDSLNIYPLAEASECCDDDNSPEFSFSINFWWGSRVERTY